MNITQDAVLNVVDNVSATIESIALELWNLAEPSLIEVQSANLLKETLKQNGFTITSEGTAGVPTAFIAEFGSGAPLLGIMTEYDALPGLGNAAVPYKQERADGHTSGHACGHNLIAAGAMGTALTLKTLMAEKNMAGTLRVYGGAAEETEGAKVYMAREGLFDDLDAMLHWHPYDYATSFNVRTAAISHMYIEFKGKTAHAGMSPWSGRSALDGVELFLHGVNLMREHVEPTARIHYIIRDGGLAPNIVPEKASVMLTYRNASRWQVDRDVDWIKDMAKGAAMATQTEALAVDYFGLYDLLPNGPLAERTQQHLEAVGVPIYTDEEREFAMTLQRNADVEAVGMASGVTPLSNEPTVGGFTDVGDVSWITPTMGISVPSLPTGIGVHTWMATAVHGTSIGTKAAVVAARVLALIGTDILTDSEFLHQVHADFKTRTEGFVYKSPLPDLVKEPVGLPDDMRQYESVTELKQSFHRRADEEALAPQSMK